MSADPSLAGDALAEFLLARLCAQSGAAQRIDPQDVLFVVDGASCSADAAAAAIDHPAPASRAARAAAAALNRLTESGFAVGAPADWGGHGGGDDRTNGDDGTGRVLLRCSFARAAGLLRRVAVVFLPDKASAAGRGDACHPRLLSGALPPMPRLFPVSFSFVSVRVRLHPVCSR